MYYYLYDILWSKWWAIDFTLTTVHFNFGDYNIYKRDKGQGNGWGCHFNREQLFYISHVITQIRSERLILKQLIHHLKKMKLIIDTMRKSTFTTEKFFLNNSKVKASKHLFFLQLGDALHCEDDWF